MLQAQQYIRSLGIYGRVSVERFDGDRLPYTDNLVNLVVSEDLGRVSQEEVVRALAPGGTLYARQDGQWTMTAKPRPPDIDEWTHFLHDASGNAVAHDDRVAPPGSLQWTEGPQYMRSHEHIPGIYAVVSSGGRIFYIEDAAPTASVRRIPQWHLVARDAFNGILLWTKPVADWFPHIVNWGQTPVQLQRRLVSVGDRVYVTLGWHAPLSAVDATTGETAVIYPDTSGTEVILWHEGVLLLVVRHVTDERIAEQQNWAHLARRGATILDARETAEPLVKRLRAAEAQGELSLLALHADSGRLLWKKTGQDISSLRPLRLCADADRVFFQNGNQVVCVDLETGQERWSKSTLPLRLVWQGSVVCADGEAATILAAQTGEERWRNAHLLTEVRDVFLAGGSLWVGGFKPFPQKRGPSWGPYFATQLDLMTGEVLRHIEPENPSHHHRCYPNKATDRFLLGGRRGTEFIDLASGDVLWNSWARGVCKYGVMPCNGLLYVPPHACGCYIAAKMISFNALAPSRSSSSSQASEVAVVEHGPAFDSPHSDVAVPATNDWPTLRHDAERSGSTTTTVPAQLQVRWQAGVGGRLTAPTVADGTVFVASVNEQRICALDVGTGDPTWDFTAGSRVDSPPTIDQGRVLFGGRDGFIYSLRVSDGALAWRERLAREERRAVVCSQLESVLPVSGSVLVQNGVVYCTSGRSSYLDGGIELCRIEPLTGKILSRTSIYSPDPETGRQPPQAGPANMPGTREDILSADGSHIYLRDMVFDPAGQPAAKGKPHLFAMTHFLDDAWAHRSYWIFGTQCSIATGCSSRDKQLVYGRLIVFDPSTVYGYGRRQVHWSNQLQDGPYRVFARDRNEGQTRWETTLPIQVRAMILAGDILFLAGPPDHTSVGPWDRSESQSSLLLALSASDGDIMAETRISGTPVFDGLAAARGRLYLSLEEGSVVCLE